MYYLSGVIYWAVFSQMEKNVPMCQQCRCKKILSRVKSLQEITLFCQESRKCCDFALFGGIFYNTSWNFMLSFGIFCTIWVFWVFYAVLLQTRLFWLKQCLCKKMSLSMSEYFVYLPLGIKSCIFKISY